MVRRILLPLLGVIAMQVHAAGHFDIDDAGTLDLQREDAKQRGKNTSGHGRAF